MRAFGFRVRPPLFSVTLFIVQSEVKLPPRMVTLPEISQDLTKAQVCPAVTVMSPLKVPVKVPLHLSPLLSGPAGGAGWMTKP